MCPEKPFAAPCPPALEEEPAIRCLPLVTAAIIREVGSRLPPIGGAALCLLLVLMPALAAAQADEHQAVRQRIEQLVRENFYDKARAERFALPATVAANDSFDAGVASALAGLGVSHTGRYTADRIDYYELLDIYRVALADELVRLFPPTGEVTYPGIGLIAEEIDGAVFVTHVYHGGSAASTGIREGDEILAVDGRPYDEIAAFTGKVGDTVSVLLRRAATADPTEVGVAVEAIRPNALFTQSIRQSIRTIRHGGHVIGYLRLWSFTSAATGRLIHDALGVGRLAEADALILDLRSRWGGAPLDAAEIFVGGTPRTDIIDRDGNAYPGNLRWRKPVVAIIDAGTRSGLEVFAQALQANGIPLVGTKTAGAVVAGSAFILPDDSLLMLAVADVLTDGTRLEGTGVSPDLTVERDIRYANGADPQLQAALQSLTEALQDTGRAGSD